MKRSVAVLALGALATGPASGCDRDSRSGAGAATTSGSAAPSASAGTAASAAAHASGSAPPVVPAAPTASALPGATEGCPTGMVLVEGDFCPGAIQRCLEHHPEYLADSNVSERCMKFEAPSRCVSKERKRLRFCIDRYEWPNEKGTKPLVLVQWIEAGKHCASVGKRLCDEEEWLFACEGEDMLPYTYGHVRDPKKCLIDRPYVKREIGLKRYDACQADTECREHFAKLDQRQPAGAFPECVSPFGAFDLNGNANEWVNLPGKEYPNRSGLKGGWWGPVRCRCRPTVTFHKEDDWGYEAGFRCCKDAEPVAASRPGDAG